MIKQIFRFTLLLAIAFAGCACGSIEDKIEIVGYDNASIKGSVGLSTDIIFRNESGRNITIYEGAVVSLYDNDKLLISLSLKSDVLIPKRSESVAIPTLWRIEDANLMTILSLPSRFKSGSIDGIDLGAVGRVKMGLFNRDLSIRGVPLKSLLSDLE